ncbi:MAG: YggS family pyridoxal phosphate-dependent enzyme [Clostridia bacterium]
MKDEIDKLLNNVRIASQGRAITIIPATKMQTVSTISSLSSYGFNTFGENRAQELLDKFGKVDVKWQFIGSLQTNKVKYIIDKVDLIQSVDSIRLASEIDKQSKRIDKIMPILIEVNIGEEEQKSGILLEQLDELINYVLQLANVNLVGLMTVMPIGASRQLYLDMASLFNSIRARLHKADFTVLSMGMSDDYVQAIECGSTMVRIGRAIFGERNYNK